MDASHLLLRTASRFLILVEITSLPALTIYPALKLT